MDFAVTRSVCAGLACAVNRPGVLSATAARAPRLSLFAGLPVGGARTFLTGAALSSRHAVSERISRRRRQSAAAPVQAVAVGWVAATAALGGLFVGLLLAKWSQNYFAGKIDSKKSAIENARLRAKVEELQQMVTKYEPLAYKGMRLRFTRGVNKAVILGLVDELLSKKEVNIWWLPDSLERVFYFNVISLMLSVLDEITEGMSVNFAGHNVKLQLTYLDMEQEAAAAAAAAGRSQQTPSGVPLLPAT